MTRRTISKLPRRGDLVALIAVLLLAAIFTAMLMVSNAASKTTVASSHTEFKAVDTKQRTSMHG